MGIKSKNYLYLNDSKIYIKYYLKVLACYQIFEYDPGEHSQPYPGEHSQP